MNDEDENEELTPEDGVDVDDLRLEMETEEAKKKEEAFAKEAGRRGLTWDATAECWLGPKGSQFDRYGNEL